MAATATKLPQHPHHTTSGKTTTASLKACERRARWDGAK